MLTGYRASNNVNVKFPRPEASGAILDALVAEGANQINGPSLTIDKPEEAYDEARIKAIAAGRAVPSSTPGRSGSGSCDCCR